jgi:CRP/FNR family transcriptional regulator, cyclic AMP receptor protein
VCVHADRGYRKRIREGYGTDERSHPVKFFKPATSSADLPGLESLSEPERDRVLDVGRVVHIPGSWSAIHDREPADEAYLVLEGTMRVDSDGKHVADIGPGAFAGEMGLVDRTLRNARVTTVGDVTALAFPRADFQALREEISAFDDLVTESTHDRRHQS